MLKKKSFIFLAIVFLAAAYVFGNALYYNNRDANDLSSYCHIDFQGIIDTSTNRVTYATLSLTDYRYFDNALEAFCIIEIGGKSYQVDAADVNALPPTFSLVAANDDTRFKYTHTLLIKFAPPILKEIQTADMVKISFKYKNSGEPLTFPLSQPDLRYWKDQLRLL